jgi:DNA-binding NtrC family response regulator/tetratricopeptide (TPR) repeat protein
MSAGSETELAELYFSLDRYDDALAAIEQVRERTPRVVFPASLRLVEAACRFHLGDHAMALEILASLRDAAAVRANPAIRGRVDTLESWICLERGDLDAGAIAAESALSDLSSTSDHVSYGEALLASGRIYLRQGRLDAALERFRDALATFRRANSFSGMGRAFSDMAIVDKSQGRLREAESGYAKALAIAEQLGQRRFLMTRRHNLAVLLFHLGNARASLSLAEGSLAIAVELGESFVEACARLTCARALMADDADSDRALELLERALAIAAARGFRREEALANEFLGDLAWKHDERATAEAFWLRALAIIETVAPHGDVAGEALRRLAEARAAAGDATGAYGFARRALHETTACGDQRERAIVRRVIGRIAAARGHVARAESWMRASAAGLQAVGAPRDLADTLAELERLSGAREAATPESAAAASGDERPATRSVRLARVPIASAAQHVTVRGAKGKRALLTRDPGFAALLERVSVVSKRSGAVLLLGESGTGKELLARLVHDASGRKGRFVAANVAAIPEGLVESELFGHVRGAFTGASEEKIGLLEAADGGTFFLDEIGDLPPSIQVKLLRLLDDSAVKRVGAIHERVIDIRFVAATNRDLRRMVREGAFRSDLFYRLSVHEISIPPLRERRSDVPLLAAHFLARLAENDKVEPPAICADALAALDAYSWPGNIRELQSEMERTYSHANGAPEIRVSHLSHWIGSLLSRPDEDAGVLRGEVAALERGRIQDALARSRGNMARAADALGVTPQALRYKIRKYGLLNDRFRSAGGTSH